MVKAEEAVNAQQSAYKFINTISIFPFTFCKSNEKISKSELPFSIFLITFNICNVTYFVFPFTFWNVLLLYRIITNFFVFVEFPNSVFKK